jgi:hypothetical protein
MLPDFRVIDFERNLGDTPKFALLAPGGEFGFDGEGD